MLQLVLQFTQNPIYEEDENRDLSYRIIVLIKLIGWALVISLGFLILASAIENVFELNFGEHASEDLFENYSTLALIAIIVIAAPLIEELIFRGPLYWFRNKTALRIALYTSIVLFGFIHLANFEDYSSYWWMTPLLVAPQLSLGMFAGFIRVRFGLVWSMALHAGYNLAVSLPLIIVDVFHISLE